MSVLCSGPNALESPTSDRGLVAYASHNPPWWALDDPLNGRPVLGCVSIVWRSIMVASSVTTVQVCSWRGTVAKASRRFNWGRHRGGLPHGQVLAAGGVS